MKYRTDYLLAVAIRNCLSFLSHTKSDFLRVHQILKCCAFAGCSGPTPPSVSVRGGAYQATQRRAVGRSCPSMRCPRCMHPPRCLYSVSQERTFVAVKPDGVQVQLRVQLRRGEPARVRGYCQCEPTLSGQLLNSVAGTSCLSRQLTV